MLAGPTAAVLVPAIGIAGAGAETGGKSDGHAALTADSERQPDGSVLSAVDHFGFRDAVG